MGGSGTIRSSNSISGRENAIEALIDMEPRGGFIRASAVLEEANASALSSRPNLIPTASIREVANILSHYVIGTRSLPQFRELQDIDIEKQRLIYAHHAKIMSRKSMSDVISAPSYLLKNLKEIWTKDDDLLKSIITHKLFCDKTSKAKTDGKDKSLVHCESTFPSVEHIISRAIENHLSTTSVSSILICVMVIFLSNREGATSSLLQIGAVLSLLPCKHNENQEIFKYFHDVAIMYQKKVEERVKMLEKKKMEDEEKRKKREQEEKENEEKEETEVLKTNETDFDESETQNANNDEDEATRLQVSAQPDEDDGTLLQSTDVNTPSSSSRQFGSANVVNDSDSLHHHMLLAAAVSLPDEFAEEGEEEVIEIENQESSSSSSSSADGEQHEDDEEVLLQQALALSLADAADIDKSTSEKNSANNLFPEDVETEDISLPPPPTYPYLSMEYEPSKVARAQYGPEEVLPFSHDGTSFFDPSSFEDFGSLPGNVAMIHLLHYLESFVLQSHEDENESVFKPCCPGGVGSHFFQNQKHDSSSSSFTSNDDIGLSIHLLLTLVIFLTRTRDDLMETLCKIPDRIKISRKNDADDPANLQSPTPLSLAGNESSEENTATTLQEKGMRRKAAAAADAAAARLEHRERKRAELKESLNKLTESLASVFKILLHFLKYTNPDLKYGKRVMDSLVSLTKSRADSFIYVSSIQTYAYMFPLVYKTNSTREKMLLEMLKRYSESLSQGDEISSTEWTEEQVNKKTVDAICQRLCQVDVIDGLISLPVLNILITIVTLQKTETNVTNFFYALIHKTMKKTLLWNTIGFDKIVSLANSSKSSSNSVFVQASSSLQFDQSRCAESIAILSNKTTVHQRASKAWGTVLSTTSFSPKSGIHKWAIKLDKCEKGHVFVGVATSQAGTRTYVGGDRHGWGLIGTQALWHHRSKIRGDYGSTFRTGSTVIATLDTDIGTLSFGLLSSASQNTDSISSDKMIAVGRNGSSISSSFVDWGVAFEGLPLDSKLYPAVGLYQRDDKVTLMNVKKHQEEKINEDLDLEKSREMRKKIGLGVSLNILSTAQKLLLCNDNENLLLKQVLPCFAANLCLIPYNELPRFVGGQYAMNILPLLAAVINLCPDESVRCFKEGDWIVRADCQESSDNSASCVEEYHVKFNVDKTNSVSGSGKGEVGKGKGGVVDIKGNLNGTLLQFVEEWMEENNTVKKKLSSCVIQARMSLDGERFEGKYWNVSQKSRGLVAGAKVGVVNKTSCSAFLKKLLCLAYSHLAGVFCGNPVALDMKHCYEQGAKKWKSSKLINPGLRLSVDQVQKTTNELLAKYNVSTSKNDAFVDSWSSFVFKNIFADDTNDVPISIIPERMDEWALSFTGGNGSLSKLAPAQFSTAKRTVLASLMYHSQLYSKSVEEFVTGGPPSDEIMLLWQNSRTILESSIRNYISLLGPRKGCAKACEEITIISHFLVKIRSPCKDQALVLEFIKNCTIEDIARIKREMEGSNNQACLYAVGIASVRYVLENVASDASLEYLILSLAKLFLRHKIHCEDDLRGVCWQGLEGSSFEKCLQRELNTLIEMLFERIQDDMNESTLIVVLSCLQMAILKQESRSMFCHILDKISKFLVTFRKYLNGAPVGADVSLKDSLNWHLKRKVFCSSFYTFYILVIHICVDKRAASSYGERALSTLLREFDNTISWISERSKNELVNHAESTVSNDIESWSQVFLSPRNIFEDDKEEKNGNNFNGIEFLQRNGGVKDSFVAENPSTTTTSERIFYNLETPEHYFSALLNVLFLMVQSKEMKSKMMGTTWINSLLSASENIYMPCRERVIRLLRFILVDQKVTSETFERLLLLAGSAKPDDDDSYTKSSYFSYFKVAHEGVRRESISLLRYLNMSSTIHKETIKMLIRSSMKKNWDQNHQIVRGCLSYLGGNITAPVVGSYVLFKPVSTSDKGIGNNAVGGGIDNVISGLSRRKAFAGLITNLDNVNDSCEVVLIKRNSSCENNVKDDLQSPGMMVRAARVPFSDVVCAEEMPLILDKDMSDIVEIILSNFVNSFYLIFDTTSREEISSSFLKLVSMSIRCSLLMLSNKDIARSISQSREFSFAHVLKIGSEKKDDGTTNYLPFLRQHESQYFKLCSELSELEKRRYALHITPTSTFNLRPFRKRVDESKISECSGGGVNSTGTPLTSADDGNESVSTTDTNSANAVTTSSSHENNSGSGNNSNDEDAHLREAAIAQMAELGLPRSWSELALRRTGGSSVEAAVHFCLERGGEMEHMLAEERDRNQSSGSSTRLRSANSDVLIQQLLEMGFPDNWCRQALEATRNNVDDALTWILTNGERLSGQDIEEGEEDVEDEEDEDEEVHEDEEDGAEDEEDDDDQYEMVIDDIEDADADEPIVDSLNEEDEDELASEYRIESTNNLEINSAESSEVKKKTDEEKDTNKDLSTPPAWSGSICPLRFVSGRSSIDTKTLSISGLSSGGFSSVGTKGVLHTSGKWYYEAELLTAGCLQIGWSDGSFAGHCQAEKGDGCGDGPSSWAFDGWRRYRWHGVATEWGSRWKVGDIVGCAVDMDCKIISFTLNGQGEEIGMGTAFEGHGFRPCGGVYACVSFNWKEKLKISLSNFKFGPPEGYRGVGEAVIEAVKEYSMLLREEAILGDYDSNIAPNKKRFLCDFSDGEHGHELFAWQHRYYGSDASVHLGSGKSAKKKSKCSSKESSLDLKERIQKSWENGGNSKDFEMEIDESEVLNKEAVVKFMEKGYLAVKSELESMIKKEVHSLSILYSKKLMLQLIVTLSEEFDLSTIFSSNEVNEATSATNFWRVLDNCCCLRAAGWIGEASAMAMAAEALGLGISTHDSTSSASNRLKSSGNGLTQLLTPAVFGRSDADTSMTYAACAEAALVGDSGGCLIYLKEGLQNAASKSESFQNVLVAAVGKAVRLLAVVEYTKEDTASSDVEDGDDIVKSLSDLDSFAPDARLASFWTGLLLSPPVLSKMKDPEECASKLFNAWSVGLLSASAPWRMICALTISGILNLYPCVLGKCASKYPTLAKYYARLESTVVRRVWAERAAVPVCSRYIQAFIELLSSVRSTPWFFAYKIPISVDSATPLHLECDEKKHWEWSENWVTSDEGLRVYTGTVQYMTVEWKLPTRSQAQIKMDAGEGPPMLNIGCKVMRGPDWNRDNDDGKAAYDKEKKHRDAIKELEKLETGTSPEDDNDDEKEQHSRGKESLASLTNASTSTEEKKQTNRSKKKIPPPKVPVGVVTGIEPYNGIPALARRVRWNLTGKEDIYRYGGDGGCYDILHVEVNERSTKVKKKHPVPESAEQCAARHGFGYAKKFNVLLRVRCEGIWDEENSEMVKEGILEYPDFGAGIKVKCIYHQDDAVTIIEEDLIFGSKNCGWEPRFGKSTFQPGSTITLTQASLSLIPSEFNEIESGGEDITAAHTDYEEYLGSSSFVVHHLRDKMTNEKVRVTYEMKLCCNKSNKIDDENDKISQSMGLLPPPLCFDKDFHPSSMAISRDGKTVSCITPEGRGTAFASVGFSKGVHYWEVKLEHADIGSVFIGVSEKPNNRSSLGSPFSEGSRLNRWLGWGFVNFRATYTAGSERVYGAHCHSTDTVGVLLDCDAGRISFFFDGVKYGEHIMNDLGCAFENISPFGFNADGCGSGGCAQGAPSGTDRGPGGRYPSNGAVKPRALWPVIGLKNLGDKVTFSGKWMTSCGVDGVHMLQNVLKFDEVLKCYEGNQNSNSGLQKELPDWFIKESFNEYKFWEKSRYVRSSTRGVGPFSLTTLGLNVDLDTSPFSCACACASLGLPYVLLPGDVVSIKRSAGRMLELPEEAKVLGACQGRLFYKIISQKSEGGSLTEGGGRAWFWDESEVVDNALKICGTGLGFDIELPLLDRFKCPYKGGLKVVYQNGAVVRSDLEIMDGSANIGTIPQGVIIPKADVLERRMNSCGVIRYRIKYELFGGGWISSRIRGGKEEAIVEPVNASVGSRLTIGEDTSTSVEEDKPSFRSPEAAAAHWFKKFNSMENQQGNKPTSFNKQLEIVDLEEFKKLLALAKFPHLSYLESDALLARAVSSISDFSARGDPVDNSFLDIVPSFCVAINNVEEQIDVPSFGKIHSGACDAASAVFATLPKSNLPSTKSLIARIAMLKALNRRARNALSWMSCRPIQEVSAVFGGSLGYGASVERAGRSCSAREEYMKWFQAQSIPNRIRMSKMILFNSVKRLLLESLMDTTTIPTPPSHDEYELPREVRTVRVNRLKARRAMSSHDQALKKKHSVFAQLQHEMRGWSGVALRRGHVAKGHGGQKRAFRVKLVGEGVNDYSGPYREVFTDAIKDILQVDEEGNSKLGFLERSPNSVGDFGEKRDLYVFANGNKFPDDTDFHNLSREEQHLLHIFSSTNGSNDESVREVEEAIIFLGKLTGTACRHGIPVDLPLPLRSVWDKMTEDPNSIIQMLHEVDVLASRQLKENEFKFSTLLEAQQRMLNAFVEGVSSVIPTEIFSLFSGPELRDIICGNPDVDVELLRRVVEYEGYDENDVVVKNFWEVLREMSNRERKLFLQFVWARSCLPMKESDFEAPFKILKSPKSDSEGATALPSASTCFFSLTLPDYSCKETLKSKLMFAIENVTTMESDYVTNDSEVNEGWRGL